MGKRHFFWMAHYTSHAALDNMMSVSDYGLSRAVVYTTIPYGWSDLSAGLDFEISESNTVVVAGERLHVRAIARYSYDATTGKWAFAGRTRGPKVSGSSSATPTKYVLEWRPSNGLVLMVR